MDDRRYGLLCYTGVNIGDDIQSLAASRFLPKVDYYVMRERVDRFRKCSDDMSPEKVKLLMNAFWMWEPKHFPPSSDIDPLFVSFHWQSRIRDDKNFGAKTIAYLKAHEPIGCRDMSTVEYLNQHGIKAYFSGCVTLTMLPNPKLKNRIVSDYILCVDTPQDVVDAVRAKSKYPVYCTTRRLNPMMDQKQRLKLAKAVLFLYHNARCVVTPRLHVSQPCLAFGTPVLLLKNPDPTFTTRFEGLYDLFNNAPLDGKNDWDYDINNPPPNPDGFLKIREGLVEKCSAFTGFDSGCTMFEDDYNPLAEMVQCLSYKRELVPKILMYGNKSELLRLITDRLTGKKVNDFIYKP